MKRVALLFVIFVVAGGAAAMDTDRLELAVTNAKTAYVQDPNEENLATLEAAVDAMRSTPTESSTHVKAMIAEIEPNDSSATAAALGNGDFVLGTISPAADVDYHVNGGNGVRDLVFAFVVAQYSATSTDSQLNVYADDGSTLIEFDDDGGPGLSSCAAGGEVPVMGDVYFAVNDFLNDDEITPYELHQVIASAGDLITEVEPNDTAGTATPITATLVDGSLVAGAVDTDYFSFEADVGERIVVIMDEDPDGDDSSPNTAIEILDTDGMTSLAAGDNFSFNENNCAGSVSAPATGTYFVRVTDGGSGSDLEYRFTVLAEGREVPVELMNFAVE